VQGTISNEFLSLKTKGFVLILKQQLFEENCICSFLDSCLDKESDTVLLSYLKSRNSGNIFEKAPNWANKKISGMLIESLIKYINHVLKYGKEPFDTAQVLSDCSLELMYYNKIKIIYSAAEKW
jgi:hypothetical protein